MLKILEEVTGIDPLYPTDDLLIDSDLPRRFPPDFARMHNLLPVFYDAQGVQVLTVTPFLGTLASECATLLGAPVRLRLTEPDFLERLIETTYQNLGEADEEESDSDVDDDWQKLEQLDDIEEQAQAAPV